METLGWGIQGSHESQPSASAYNSGSYWPHSFLSCQECNSPSEVHARDNLAGTNCGIRIRIGETTVLLEKALAPGARDCGKGPGGQGLYEASWAWDLRETSGRRLKASKAQYFKGKQCLKEQKQHSSYPAQWRASLEQFPRLLGHDERDYKRIRSWDICCACSSGLPQGFA